ncbi:uncharacterized protein G2W53_041394 [Senna tora]|uniref:Uncharacterized protein n=1 Tax=Senna tora TaxID=362788 RepID=A0A834SES0_9FABA|nr:uncharacterized protein G2W53_041394 [Senna tora]
MTMQKQNKEGEEVLMEIGNIIMAKEMEPIMKENINPEMCIKGAKKWKKIARVINENITEDGCVLNGGRKRTKPEDEDLVKASNGG